MTVTHNGGAALAVYVGTYTRSEPHVQGKADGLYIFHMDQATGALTGPQTVPGLANPTYLAVEPRRRFLYVSSEVGEHGGRPGGAVSAFAIDPGSAGLRLLNQQPTHGGASCHVCVDRDSRWVVVSNYGGGSITALPIQEDGTLGKPAAVVQHEGSSVNLDRQAEPHAHSATIDPHNRRVLVADLGIDQVLVYGLDEGEDLLAPNDPPGARLAPGAGPRHTAFHPNGRFFYCINELNSTLTVFGYDGERGALHELQTISTLPSDFAGASHCAHVVVHPSGGFVYGSNRGHDSIAAFAVDTERGTLAPIGHTPTGGRTPRNFALDPSGAFLVAANQDSDTLVTFRIDAASGALAPTGHVTKVLTPACVQIVDLSQAG